LLLVAGLGLAQAQERVLELPDGGAVQYSVVEPGGSSLASARETAARILGYLAAGHIEEAAVLSNAPRRRYEVLRDYRDRVGELEFKRVFTQYLLPDNRLIAEIAIGARRLLIWDLAEAGHHLAGQYYIEIDGKFVMDDVPNEERSRLQRILTAYRSGKIAR
jgi:hypothetical protein